MHRLPLMLLAGAIIATSGLTAGLTPSQDPAATEDAPERYLLRFDPLPRNLSMGQTYGGGEIVHLDPVLGFAAVSTNDPQALAAQASQQDALVAMEPDAEVHALVLTPDDPRFPEQYGPAQIRAPEAWALTTGSTEAGVCVLDTGLRHTHEDLAGPRWQGGIDLHNGDGDPWDDHGHGTHVTGTAAAGLDNGLGIAGMGNLAVHAVKVLSSSGSGYSSNVASGIRWCADHAGPRTVISMSLGSTAKSLAVEDAVSYARAKGLLLVAAAGNAGACADCISYPAASPGVVAVTCTGPTRARCSFSSQGPQAELAAPGQAILSAWNGDDSAYTAISGTSMSTPHVSGAAALIWSHVPELTADDLRTLLTDTATDLGPTGRDPSYGYGLLDVAAALQAATGTPSPPPPSLEPVLTASFDDGSPGSLELSGLWHVSQACLEAASPPGHLAYRRPGACDYATGARTQGTAQLTVDLRQATTAKATLQHRWTTESYPGAYDVMTIEASTDGGQSWTTLRQWDAREANQATWQPLTLDLDPLVGHQVTLAFGFDSRDAIANSYPGWALDDLQVLADLPGDPPPPDPNQPPAARAGADQQARDHDGSGTEPVQLDGSASSDPDGQLTAYAWRSATGTLLATGARPSLELPTGLHRLSLTVTDDGGATASDAVEIQIASLTGPARLLEADMEAGLPGWSFSSGVQNLWRVGAGCLGAVSGASSLQFNQAHDCDYAITGPADGVVTSPPVDATGQAPLTLTFQHAWRTESWPYGAYDVMRVQARAGPGQAWSTLAQWDSRDANQPSFQAVELDLTAHAGPATQVRFSFDTRDGIGNQYPGWAIDDVQVVAGR